MPGDQAQKKTTIAKREGKEEPAAAVELRPGEELGKEMRKLLLPDKSNCGDPKIINLCEKLLREFPRIADEYDAIYPVWQLHYRSLTAAEARLRAAPSAATRKAYDEAVRMALAHLDRVHQGVLRYGNTSFGKRLIYKILVHRGDVERYRDRNAPQRARNEHLDPTTAAVASAPSLVSSFEDSIASYHGAARMLPDHGLAHNQLAVVYQAKGEQLKALHAYVRAAYATKKPFAKATKNFTDLLAAGVLSTAFPADDDMLRDVDEWVANLSPFDVPTALEAWFLRLVAAVVMKPEGHEDMKGFGSAVFAPLLARLVSTAAIHQPEDNHVSHCTLLSIATISITSGCVDVFCVVVEALIRCLRELTVSMRDDHKRRRKAAATAAAATEEAEPAPNSRGGRGRGRGRGRPAVPSSPTDPSQLEPNAFDAGKMSHIALSTVFGALVMSLRWVVAGKHPALSRLDGATRSKLQACVSGAFDDAASAIFNAAADENISGIPLDTLATRAVLDHRSTSAESYALSEDREVVGFRPYLHGGSEDADADGNSAINRGAAAPGSVTELLPQQLVDAQITQGEVWCQRVRRFLSSASQWQRQDHSQGKPEEIAVEKELEQSVQDAAAPAAPPRPARPSRPLGRHQRRSGDTSDDDDDDGDEVVILTPTSP